jgi:membrane carboxypeptidase/penicillin-binding protein PbpC
MIIPKSLPIKLDVIFDHVKVYDFKSLEVELGQSFEIIAQNAEGCKWFFENDPIIDATVDGSTANIIAMSPGKSTVALIKDSIVKLQFDIVVYTGIKLNPVVTKIEMK